MKKLLLPMIAGCATLLPVSQVEAFGIAGKTFGGFTRGQEFTLTVTERLSIRTSGTDITRHVPVPDGMPDFKKGRDVKFTIGKGGRLKGSGFSIAYQSSESRVNLYSNNPSGFESDGQAGTVTKNKKQKPIGATLTFYEFRFSGFRPVTNSVSYVLD